MYWGRPNQTDYATLAKWKPDGKQMSKTVRSLKPYYFYIIVKGLHCSTSTKIISYFIIIIILVFFFFTFVLIFFSFPCSCRRSRWSPYRPALLIINSSYNISLFFNELASFSLKMVRYFSFTRASLPECQQLFLFFPWF